MVYLYVGLLEGEENSLGNYSYTVNQVVQPTYYVTPQGYTRSPARERALPVTNVVRIMRQVLPPQAKITDECKEAMVECAANFITFITKEASRQCKLEHRKTIIAEDVVCNMGKLGFDNYAEVCNRFLQRYRQNAAIPYVPTQESSIIDGVPLLPPAFDAPSFPVGQYPFPDSTKMDGFYIDESSGGDSSNANVRNDSFAYFNPDDNIDN
ncbi:hypothetical protein SESBI_21605 [Sesbania bispinosa]|nr:hypothetical protein SESBI_21605 [Sesbania bispinosa]